MLGTCTACWMSVSVQVFQPLKGNEMAMPLRPAAQPTASCGSAHSSLWTKPANTNRVDHTPASARPSSVNSLERECLPARLPSIAAPSVPDDITFDLNNSGKKSGAAKALSNWLQLRAAQPEPTAAAQGIIGRRATIEGSCSPW